MLQLPGEVGLLLPQSAPARRGCRSRHTSRHGRAQARSCGTEPQVAELARATTDELGRQSVNGISPMYNMLPAIIWDVARDGDLEAGDVAAILHRAVGYAASDKQRDAVVRKLLARLAEGADVGAAAAAAFARCLGGLALRPAVFADVRDAAPRLRRHLAGDDFWRLLSVCRTGAVMRRPLAAALAWNERLRA